MKKYAFLLTLFLVSWSAFGVVPTEKKVPGRIDSLSIRVPDGESFSNVRAVWLQKVSEECEFKEFKIQMYSERNESYGDGLSLNPNTGKYEGEKIPAAVSGVFQCLEIS